jgi:hypothetical protein
MQNKDGSYTLLSNTNNGHSLIIPISESNSVGYMHTHLEPINAGDINNDCIDDFRKPIQMFSPKDINIFLRIARNTKNNGIPLSSVYGTMVSKHGTYTLRFTGNPNDISSYYNLNKTEYKRYFKKYKSDTEKTILNFLKDKVNLNGIELYKIKDNGTIQKKTLSVNGSNVDSDDCN